MTTPTINGQIPHGERLKPGWCQHCGEECRDRLGSDIYPHRPDLAAKVIWECVFCGARVGTHEAGPNKGQPLGTAANEELRRARELMHARLDPIWQLAHNHYPDAKLQQGPERIKALAIIKRTARSRVYRFLAEKMAMRVEDCHIAMFSLEECRQAWVALRGVDYQLIRKLAHANVASSGADRSIPEDSGTTNGALS